MVNWEKQNIMPYALCYTTWIFNAPDIENKTAYIEFIKETIKVQLSNHLQDPELFELIKTYRVHAHSRNCRKYNKNIT